MTLHGTARVNSPAVSQPRPRRGLMVLAPMGTRSETSDRPRSGHLSPRPAAVVAEACRGGGWPSTDSHTARNRRAGDIHEVFGFCAGELPGGPRTTPVKAVG